MSVLAVPEDWIQTTLDEISIYIQRGKGPKYSTELNDFPVVNQKAIRWFGIEKEHLKYVDQAQWGSWDQERFIQENDILWNSTGTGTVGRACFVDSHELPKAKVVDSHVTIVRASKKVSGKYIFYWVMHPEVQSKVGGLYTGTTNQVELTKKMVQEIEIPLPPLAEQKVIVNKLDIFLAQVESIKARLERIPEILKQFRQSVLAAAVNGKLMEEWDVKDCLLSDVLEFQNGYAFKSEWFSDAGAYQVIKLGNIRDGRLFLENAPAYVDTKIGQEFERFKPIVGDTLISMTGTRFKQDYGFGCLVETDQDILINQRVGRLIPIREKITPEYLNLFVRSEQFRKQFFQGETGGVNQGNVGSKHIMSLSIKVPLIEIQIEVVNKVLKALNAVTVIERQAELALERVNNLTQSILAKAFRGELTADWREANPDLINGENSVEALLERIKLERLAKPVTKRGRGKA